MLDKFSAVERLQEGVRPIESTSKVLSNKRWLLEYKSIIDWDLYRNDKKEFLRRMALVNGVTRNIDYDSNLVFLCNNNCSSFVFLSGLCRPGYIRSVYSCNMMNLVDIFTDHYDVDKDYGSIYSVQDIEQDILCLLVTKEMSDCGDYGKIISSALSGRAMKRNRYGKPLYNWIFFIGSEVDFRTSKSMKYIYNLFLSGNSFDSSKWLICDLRSSLGDINSRVSCPDRNVSTSYNVTDSSGVGLNSRLVDDMY